MKGEGTNYQGTIASGAKIYPGKNSGAIPHLKKNSAIVPWQNVSQSIEK